MGFSKIFSRSSEVKEKEALDDASSCSNHEHSPPPPMYAEAPPIYDAEDMQRPPNVTAGFSKLNLNAKSIVPTQDECIAHLKLLESFYRLKQKIGSADGIFGISNACVKGGIRPDDSKILNTLAEKRWAVYLSRAVDRFHHWRSAIAPSMAPMTVKDCEAGGRLGSELRSDKRLPSLDINGHSMPPLDVLMVWHSYMLNPRAYLEDCLRGGHMTLWHTPMPWSTINSCIDNTTFKFTAPYAAKEFYPTLTGDSWDNLHDPMTRKLPCTRFYAPREVPWTTFGEDIRDSGCASEKGLQETAAAGRGFADKGFSATCRECKEVVNHESRTVDKFVDDLRILQDKNIVMPGTLLGESGIPIQIDFEGRPIKDVTCIMGMTFPNKLFSTGLGARLIDSPTLRSMADVRSEIEDAMKDKRYMKEVKGSFNGVPTRHERMFIRRMMSRYWNNPSPFALDLVGAVVRQGSFIEKMHGIDWLHSPALPSTMKRLLTKYQRFFTILKDRSNMAVPTLDIDLAWHTHQLNPHSYVFFSASETSQFIDHDDKVAETRLNDSFAWTSKTYQKLFNEPYSECTCSYCEAVRESHTSTTTRLFKKSASIDAHHAGGSGGPQSTDPRKSIHISAHNAVAPTDDEKYNEIAARKLRDLERCYEKACHRATKKGKPKPRRDDYYYSDAYGYPIYIPLYAPYMYMGATPAVYAGNPACMALATGASGNCCAGTCGAAVAAGGCGSSAMGGCMGMTAPGCATAGTGAFMGVGAGPGCGGGAGFGGGGCGGGGGGC